MWLTHYWFPAHTTTHLATHPIYDSITYLTPSINHPFHPPSTQSIHQFTIHSNFQSINSPPFQPSINQFTTFSTHQFINSLPFQPSIHEFTPLSTINSPPIQFSNPSIHHPFNHPFIDLCDTSDQLIQHSCMECSIYLALPVEGLNYKKKST